MKTADITELMDLRDLDQAVILERLGASPDDLEHGYTYQSMTGLSMVRTKRYHGAKFFFDGDRLVMIALGASSISPSSLRSLMGPGVVELRSRQGKRAALEVDVKRGLAFSADDDEVGFVEVFPPTTEHDYRERIYKEPPPFRK